MTKHSPTPWWLDMPEDPDYIFSHDGMVAEIRGFGADLPREANALFIVTAVNAHDALVEALKATRAYVEGKPVPFSDHDCRWCNACVDRMNQMQKAALKLAGGAQ